MDKAKVGKDGEWELGQEKVVVGKWRQLYSNNNKKKVLFKTLRLYFMP